MRSAAGVVGPLAASARMRHCNFVCILFGNDAIHRRRNEHITLQGEQLVWIDMVGLVERFQMSLLEDVLLGGFYVDSFRIVDRGVGIADPNDFDAALVGEREGCHRTDIAESLHDRQCTCRDSVSTCLMARSIR